MESSHLNLPVRLGPQLLNSATTDAPLLLASTASTSKTNLCNFLAVQRPGSVFLFYGVSSSAWLGHARCELECDSIANSISAAILRRPLEPLNEDAAVSFNDSAGSNIIWVRRDFDVFQPLSASMFQHQFQRQLGIAAAFLPWHNRIANVSEDVRGQL